MGFDFSGGSHVVELGAGADYINGLTEATWMAWVKSDVTGTNNGVLNGINPATSGSDRFVGLRYDSAGADGGGTNVVKAGLEVSGTEHNCESASFVQTTELQHLLACWESGTQLRIFIDGVETVYTFQDPAQAGSITGCVDFYIGKGAKDGGGTAGWDGLVEDVRFYSRAISPDEILTIYNSRGHDGIVDGLVARYLLNERSPGDSAGGAGSVIDSGPGGRHADPTNSPVYGTSFQSFRKLAI